MAVTRVINLGAGGNSFYSAFWESAWQNSVSESNCRLKVYVHEDFFVLHGHFITDATTQLLGDQKIGDYTVLGLTVNADTRFLCQGTNNVTNLPDYEYSACLMQTSAGDRGLYLIGTRSLGSNTLGNPPLNHRYEIHQTHYFLEQL